MGRETKTAVTHHGQAAEARIHLDSEQLTIGPPIKVKLALGDVKAAAGVDGLTLETGGESYQIAMSDKEAGAWAKAIAHPPSLADKLGIKLGTSVALVGPVPDEIRALATASKDAALIVAAVNSLDVKALVKIAKMVPEKGAVWLIYEKGLMKGDQLIFAAREAGLKDTKVARISETHTGLRFIVKS
jgi:hypothetical protein